MIFGSGSLGASPFGGYDDNGTSLSANVTVYNTVSSLLATGIKVVSGSSAADTVTFTPVSTGIQLSVLAVVVDTVLTSLSVLNARVLALSTHSVALTTSIALLADCLLEDSNTVEGLTTLIQLNSATTVADAFTTTLNNAVRLKALDAITVNLTTGIRFNSALISTDTEAVRLTVTRPILLAVSAADEIVIGRIAAGTVLYPFTNKYAVYVDKRDYSVTEVMSDFSNIEVS